MRTTVGFRDEDTVCFEAKVAGTACYMSNKRKVPVANGIDDARSMLCSWCDDEWITCCKYARLPIIA